jgi:transketolase
MTRSQASGFPAPAMTAHEAGAAGDWLAINTIRTLVIDAVQAAQSGHPGAAMALAPVGYTLWNDALRYDVRDPAWMNRDRFVLSAGHASMLLYSLLHLAQVQRSAADSAPAVSLPDIKRFRQLGSVCAGHPEHGLTPGVECTTGPLSTGAGASVGMAIAGQWLARHYNRPGFPVFGYNVYAVVGDGCMMEGLGHEAASLAGHLRLGQLCWIYDSNRVTIEGPTDLAFSEDVEARFTAYGWQVVHVHDVADLDALRAAYALSSRTTDRPTLIVVETVIGVGAPVKQGTAAAHSEPLGADEARAAKRSYGWPQDAAFLVPHEAYDRFASGVGARGRQLREQWDAMLEGYRQAHPALAAELDLMTAGALPDGWDDGLPAFSPSGGEVAGRAASQDVLNVIAARVPWLLGGASDLAPSTKTRLTFAGAGDFQAGDLQAGDLQAGDYGGRNLHFGAREAAAAAAANGMALCGVRPFQAGFLVFSDFQRGPLRLSALMGLPVVHIYTHDSISMGEDGPTHQPVEQLTSLRAMPGVVDLRPADGNEIREAWRVLLPITDRPVALVLSKQEAPVLDRGRYAPASGLARGGYVLADPPGGGPPEAIIIASGSEVALAVRAYEELSAGGVAARVVSLPSWALFGEQGQAYRDMVLPPAVTARVAVEQAAVLGWERWVGGQGTVIGMRSFGASGPGRELRRHFGFTAEAVAEAVRAALHE